MWWLVVKLVSAFLFFLSGLVYKPKGKTGLEQTVKCTSNGTDNDVFPSISNGSIHGNGQEEKEQTDTKREFNSSSPSTRL